MTTLVILLYDISNMDDPYFHGQNDYLILNFQVFRVKRVLLQKMPKKTYKIFFAVGNWLYKTPSSTYAKKIRMVIVVDQ